MGSSVHTSGGGYGSHEFSLGDELRGERATLGKTLLDVQRDLRIKAAYIAAIEDCKPEVFPNQSFIPGYVRSYARHLGLDPDEVFRRFCRECGFVPGAQSRTAGKSGSGTGPAMSGGFRPDFPLARKPSRGLPRIPVGAIGSVLVLGVLLSGLGYGGWRVLQNFQRVQFAPVEDLPIAAAEVDPLAMPDTAALEEPALTELSRPVAATELAELYRQQEVEVPILVPRDGPIASLDPEATGVLARAVPAEGITPVALPEVPQELIGAAVAAAVDALATSPAVAEIAPVVIVAERPAWIRVYLENKTVIFERILESGETYALPEGITGPLIWAGNSGSVYVRVGDTLRGPLGSGTRAAKDVVLDAAALVEHFPVVENVPEVISQTLDPAAPASGAEVFIQ